MSKLLLQQPLSRPMPYDPGMPVADSPLAAALERVGDKWSLLLIESLLSGPLRFNELQASVTGIAPNILADRLRRLEGERVLSSQPYSERPPRSVYQLTGEGEALASALRLLADWGSRVAPEAEPMRHEACGTPVEARFFCPTCARAVEPGEADQIRRV